MPTNDDLLHLADRVGASSVATCQLMADVISLLAEQMNVERERLAASAEHLYAPAGADEFYQTAYNSLRNAVLVRLRNKPQGS